MDLSKLQKAIHGKTILCAESSAFGDAALECIMIWEPGGDSITIKPIGYDPEELYLIYHTHWDAHNLGERLDWDMDYFTREDYCFAALRSLHSTTRHRALLTEMADMGEGELLDWDDARWGPGYATPSCSYA